MNVLLLLQYSIKSYQFLLVANRSALPNMTTSTLNKNRKKMKSLKCMNELMFFRKKFLPSTRNSCVQTFWAEHELKSHFLSRCLYCRYQNDLPFFPLELFYGSNGHFLHVLQARLQINDLSMIWSDDTDLFL